MNHQKIQTGNSVLLDLPQPLRGTAEPEEMIRKMVGGSITAFLTEYWGRKPLFVPGAGSDCVGLYDVERYLADLEATQQPPFTSVGLRDGKRYPGKHATTEELRAGVRDGCVTSMKLSRFWHQLPTPERITWARQLFGSLCRAVSMIYMGPARSEDVDLFLAGPESQLGTHFDTTEVFTMQLFGERKWTVERDCCVERTLNLTRQPGFQPGQEAPFQTETMEIVLRPGDALYVPAYAIHQVTGVSWSVSLSLGLRAFNEIDLVESMLDLIRTTRYAEYKPAPAFPEILRDAHADAKVTLLRNVRELLRRVEMTATGFVLGPLSLPPTFATALSGVASSPDEMGPTSGLALLEERKNGMY